MLSPSVLSRVFIKIHIQTFISHIASSTNILNSQILLTDIRPQTPCVQIASLSHYCSLYVVNTGSLFNVCELPRYLIAIWGGFYSIERYFE